jgi:hypothetical protein
MIYFLDKKGDNMMKTGGYQVYENILYNKCIDNLDNKFTFDYNHEWFEEDSNDLKHFVSIVVL